MARRPLTISIPNVLGRSVDDVEQLHAAVAAAPLAPEYAFDLGTVDFVRPHGAMALVVAARQLAARTECPVTLYNLAQQIHLYLERMDLFTVGEEWLRAEAPVVGTWSRNPWTSNLLELTPIVGPSDVETAITRAERIFAPCLADNDLARLLNVLSEICANVYQHSGDPHGGVLIQRYQIPMREEMVVCLAVGDLGLGIRDSLAGRHPGLGDTALDYLRAALQGRTSRPSGRGGLGLRHVEQIAGETGGYLYLRSGSAALLTTGHGSGRATTQLGALPGTHVVVEIRTSTRS